MVPDGGGVTLGAADEGAAGEAAVGEAGALGDPAAVGDPTGTGDPAAVLAARAAVELAGELQAVTSKAAQTSPVQESLVQESTAQAANRRYLRNFAININSHPLTSPKRLGKPCHLM